MIDKIVVRLAVLVLVIFLLLAVFYQRPDNAAKRAPYLPAEGFVADAGMGDRLFAKHCIQCHGQQMQGTANGPPLIHAYYHPDHHADLAFYLAVYQGVHQHHWQFGNMPAMKQLTPDDAGHLLLYIRQAQQEAGMF